MSNLSDSKLTRNGQILDAKIKTGSEFKFSRMCLGDGTAIDSFNLNKLVSEKMERPIDKLIHLKGTNQYEVGAMFSNEGLSKGFYINEIGVYAIDPDVGEILYCYTSTEGEVNSSSYMAPGRGAVIVENDITIVTAVSNTSEVKLIIDPSITYMRDVEILNNNEKVGNVRQLNFKGQNIYIENGIANIEVASNNKELEEHIKDKSIHVSEKEKKALGEIVEGGGVGVDNIQNGAISTVKLADNSVTAPKIASEAVTTDKISDSAVTGAKILNGTITANKLASDAVTIINNTLTSTSTTEALSANQGRLLNNVIASIPRVTVNNTLTSTSTTEALSANQGMLLNVNKANLASPNFTGAPTAPTQARTDNSTRIATTAFAKQKNSLRVELGQNSEVSDWCIAVGADSIASGNSSIAVGRDTEASGIGSIAVGSDSTGAGNGSIASGNTSMALGTRSTATETASIAVGRDSIASGNSSTALGVNSEASQTHSTALGSGAKATNTHSTALGLNSRAAGTSSIALGAGSEASGNDSIALGRGTSAAGQNSIVLGFNSQTALASSVAVGANSRATGTGSTALGVAVGALGNHSTALGSNSTASGGDSVALGLLAHATGTRSVALGIASRTTHNDTAVLSSRSADTPSTTASQILLGSTAHTPFAYRALSILSDQRDKADISPLKYNALEFINKIEPKQYKLNFRCDYTRLEEVTDKEYEELDDYTKQHRVQEIPVYSIDSEIEFIDYPLIEEIDDTRSTADKFKTLIKSKLLRNREEAIAKYKDIRLTKSNNMESLTDESIEDLKDEFIEEKITKVRDMKLVRKFLPKDGSKTNNRYHNGVLAQQVKSVADEMGFDFCGFKDHSVNGGDDLYSISYEEFIAPMIGAIQQLTKKLECQEYKIQELENKLISQ